MKKLLYVLLLVVSFLLISCRSLDYADKYYDVKWSSSNPVIEFIVPDKEKLTEQNGIMEGYLIDNNGDKIEVAYLWTLTNTLQAFPLEGIYEREYLSEEFILFSCSYKMVLGNAELTFIRDNVFDNKYSKIQLVKTSLE